MRVGVRWSVAAFALLFAGCSRRTHSGAGGPPPPPPPPTLALEAANREFATGDCVGATRDFERYLDLVPSGGKREEALFHLGLISSLPECGAQDWERTEGYFKRLGVEFPQSPYKPTAQLILSLHDQAAQISAQISRLTAEGEQLRTEGTRLRNEITALQNDAAQMRANSSQLTEQIDKLRTEAELAALELNKRDQRIRQLNTQLERLIRIDSERRTRP